MTKAKRKRTKRQLAYLDLKAIIGKAETISDFMKSVPRSFQECDNYWTTQTRLKRIPKDKDEMVLTAFMEVLRDKYFSLGKDEVSEYFSEYVNQFCVYRFRYRGHDKKKYRGYQIHEYKKNCSSMGGKSCRFYLQKNGKTGRYLGRKDCTEDLSACSERAGIRGAKGYFCGLRYKRKNDYQQYALRSFGSRGPESNL